jgi:hypothetical protein
MFLPNVLQQQRKSFIIVLDDVLLVVVVERRTNPDTTPGGPSLCFCMIKLVSDDSRRRSFIAIDSSSPDYHLRY